MFNLTRFKNQSRFLNNAYIDSARLKMFRQCRVAGRGGSMCGCVPPRVALERVGSRVQEQLAHLRQPRPGCVVQRRVARLKNNFSLACIMA